MNRLPDDSRLPPHARSTVVAGGLVIAVSVFFFGLSAGQAGHRELETVSFGHALGALLAAVAAMRVNRLTLAWVLAAEVVLLAPFAVEVWLRQMWLLGTGAPFPPFQGLKLIVIALAVIVPTPVWVHVIWLAGFGLLGAALWMRIAAAGVQSAVLADEPWFTIVFFVASLSLLVYRGRSQKLSQRLLLAEARSRAFASVARLFLRIRDETNTPLQNIRLGIELLAQRHPDQADVIARMRLAVDRLEVMRGTLARYDHLIAWDGSELRADPELEALLAELEHEAKRSEV